MAFGKHTDPLVGTKTQFQPGESGNPNGMPKGSKHLSTHIQEMLNDPDFSMLLPDPKEGYKEHKGPPIKAIVRVATIRAAQGEKESREWLAKYGYGQKLQLTGEDDGPLVIKMVSYLKDE